MGEAGMVAEICEIEIGMEMGMVGIDKEGVGEIREEGVESLPDGVGLLLFLFGDGESGAFSFWTFLLMVYTLPGLLAAVSIETSLFSSIGCSS